MGNIKIDENIIKRANIWLEGNYDNDTKQEIKDLIKTNPKEVIDAFYRNLEFGTGGLRGVMGAGTNRMNRYTVGMATQGLANYLKKNGWRRGEPVASRARYNGNRFKAYKTGYKRTYYPSQLKNISLRTPWNYKGKIRLIKLNTTHYDQLWFGAKNFFVITRYNHSAYYAMSVYQLGTKIMDKWKKSKVENED